MNGKPVPIIESYGPPENPWWIRICVGKRVYEYHAGHPVDINIVRTIAKHSAWKALNLAKKRCRLARVDILKSANTPPRKITITGVRDVDPKVNPLSGLLDLLRATGQDVTYKFGKFFIYRLT